MSHAPPSVAPASTSRFKRLMQKAWWLHSFWALAFGVVVMAFARKGLAHADKVLIALGASWILVFIAFRFIVGPANRKPDEKFVRKGVRLVTNYVIKQMYQQMFFFLVPLYATSATWSLSSPNWWIVPLLLLCAVLSTMDLVFDNFIMEHRNIAAGMYGLCMFAVLNVLLPLTFKVPHFDSLIVAAAMTPISVALLSYPLRSVLGLQGVLMVGASTALLVGGCYIGRSFVAPTPLGMVAGAIGHGVPGSYECVPGPLKVTTRDRLDGLRCVSELSEPGGIREDIVHRWFHNGTELWATKPTEMPGCEGVVLKSELPADRMPSEPKGKWMCRVDTGDGQLIGMMKFRVRREKPAAADAREPATDRVDVDAGSSAESDRAASAP